MTLTLISKVTKIEPFHCINILVMKIWFVHTLRFNVWLLSDKRLAAGSQQCSL